jgi:phage shock protein C
MSERLYRSVDDRVLAGVCGGLAVRLAVDPSLVRIIYAIVALLSGIFPLLVLYVIMAVVIPEEPTGFAGRSAPAPGPGAVPGWTPPVAGVSGWAPPADAGTGPGWPPAADETAAPPSSISPGTWTAPPAGPGGGGERPSATRPGGIAGVIAGLVLVGLGVWFLVRDRLDVDWGVVWAAGLVALGVVVVLAAFRLRR